LPNNLNHFALMLILLRRLCPGPSDPDYVRKLKVLACKRY
jgi:hypothetical protein